MENQKNNCCLREIPVWKILGAVLTLFLVVFVSVLTRNEIKKYDYIGRENQQVYTIAIDGEGKVASIPDVAEILLGIETQKTKVVDAQKENTEKMNKIIGKLKEMGIESKDIKTTNYSIYPRYDWIENRQVLRGYVVNQSASVKIRNLDKIGDIVDAAGQLGANQVGSLNFTIDEPESLKQQAREKALINAKEKAEALAKIAGVKLGRLVSFSESLSPTYPIYRDYAVNEKTLGMGGGVDSSPTMEPGSHEVIVNVMVVYEVL
jgi:uncharacterized protein